MTVRGRGGGGDRSRPLDRRRLGALAEELAVRYFHSQGCTVVARNVRCRWGEADLIVRDGPEWVVVEVRARRGCRQGLPEQSLDQRKFRRLQAVGQWWLGRMGLRGEPWRIDLVAIHWPRGDGGGESSPAAPVLRHFPRLEGGAQR